MVSGFKTFGYHAEEVILRNYAVDDTLMMVARFATGIALLAAYPITFCGLRESAVTLFKMISPASQKLIFNSVLIQDAITLFFVALTTLVAVLLRDETLVVGLVGSICGSAVIFVIPCLIHVFAVRGGLMNWETNKHHFAFSGFLLTLGMFLMVAGTVRTFTSIY